MKRTVRILILITAGVMMISLFAGCSKPVKTSGITYFYYRYTTGNMVWSYVTYSLEYENGKYTATVKPDNVPDNDAVSFAADAEFEEELRGILDKYNVGKWNGFDKRDSRVMDGNSFTLNIYMEQGEISASGYMKWPDGYKDFKDEITGFFERAMNNVK